MAASALFLKLLAIVSAAKAALLKGILLLHTTHACFIISESADLDGASLSASGIGWGVPYVCLGAGLIFSTCATSFVRDKREWLAGRESGCADADLWLDIASYKLARATDLTLDMGVAMLNIALGFITMNYAGSLSGSVETENAYQQTLFRIFFFVFPSIIWAAYSTGAYDSLRTAVYFRRLKASPSMKKGNPRSSWYQDRVRPFLIFAFTSRAAEFGQIMLGMVEFVLVVFMAVFYLREMGEVEANFKEVEAIFFRPDVYSAIAKGLGELQCNSTLFDLYMPLTVNLTVLAAATSVSFSTGLFSTDACAALTPVANSTLFYIDRAPCKLILDLDSELAGGDQPSIPAMRRRCNASVVDSTADLSTYGITWSPSPEQLSLNVSDICPLSCANVGAHPCAPLNSLEYALMSKLAPVYLGAAERLIENGTLDDVIDSQSDGLVNDDLPMPSYSVLHYLKKLRRVIEADPRFNTLIEVKLIEDSGSVWFIVYEDALKTVVTNEQYSFFESMQQRVLSVMLAVTELCLLMLQLGVPSAVGGVVDLLFNLSIVLSLTVVACALKRLGAEGNHAKELFEATLCVATVHCILLWTSQFGRLARKERRLPLRIWFSPEMEGFNEHGIGEGLLRGAANGNGGGSVNDSGFESNVDHHSGLSTDVRNDGAGHWYGVGDDDGGDAVGLESAGNDELDSGSYVGAATANGDAESFAGGVGIDTSGSFVNGDTSQRSRGIVVVVVENSEPASVTEVTHQYRNPDDRDMAPDHGEVERGVDGAMVSEVVDTVDRRAVHFAPDDKAGAATTNTAASTEAGATAAATAATVATASGLPAESVPAVIASSPAPAALSSLQPAAIPSEEPRDPFFDTPGRANCVAPIASQGATSACVDSAGAAAADAAEVDAAAALTSLAPTKDRDAVVAALPVTASPADSADIAATDDTSEVPRTRTRTVNWASAVRSTRAVRAFGARRDPSRATSNSTKSMLSKNLRPSAATSDSFITDTETLYPYSAATSPTDTTKSRKPSLISRDASRQASGSMLQSFAPTFGGGKSGRQQLKQHARHDGHSHGGHHKTQQNLRPYEQHQTRCRHVAPERPLHLMCAHARPLRILCIDGGGVKGLNPTQVLQAIEMRCAGRPIREMFDLICGTSIGASMAMCISLGQSLEKGQQILTDMATKRVMVKSSALRLLTTGSKISEKDLDPMVEDTVYACGVREPHKQKAPPPSRETGVPHFFMTTCCMDKSGSWSVFVNSNYERHARGRPFQLRGSNDWPLFDRMRAAVAAPTFFPPLIKDSQHYVDAAIVANNPTLLAVKEAQSLFPGRTIGVVVSLGCGKVSNKDGRSPRAGLTYWAGQLLSMPMEVYRVHKEFQASLDYINTSSPPPAYFRLDPPTGEYELDESRVRVLDEMRKKTAAYIDHKAAKIDRIGVALFMLTDDQAVGANALMGKLHSVLHCPHKTYVTLGDRRQDYISSNCSRAEDAYSP